MQEMTASTRRDVADIVNLGDAAAVMAEVYSILARCWPDADWQPLDPLGELFRQLYEGRHPDYRGCEVGYHNAEHVLDVTLAMARLLAGRELRWGPSWSLGPDFALAGIACALLHDSGYLRRRADNRHGTGGAYTRTHVARGAALIAAQLPAAGLESLAPLCSRLIHFTNCTRSPATVRVASDAERQLGGLLGTADLLAQLAAPDYLEKCRQELYDEFEASGFAGKDGCAYTHDLAYLSRDDLMRRTPDFIHRVAGPRIEHDFAGAYHYASVWFGGRNHYLDAIVANSERLDAMLSRARSA